MKRFPTKNKQIVLYENGYYYYRSGKTFEALGTKDFKRAEEIYAKLMIELNRSGAEEPINTLIDMYVQYRHEKFLGKIKREKQDRFRTYQEIEGVTRIHLKPAFGKISLEQFDSVKWEKYCLESPVSDLTNHRKVMTGFLAWCKRKGHLKFLPDISWIPDHKKRKRRVLTDAEVTKIFELASGSFLLFLSFALLMGMRRTEIITLRWDDIDFARAALMIRDEIAKTESSARELPINPFILQMLAKRKNEFISSPRLVRSKWVFPNANDVRRHMSETGFMRPWKRLLAKTDFKNKDITWHDFRATYEKHSNKSTDHTDTQKEKMAGASIAVQKSVYITMTADDLRGLENVVQIPGLLKVLAEKSDEKTKNEKDFVNLTEVTERDV